MAGRLRLRGISLAVVAAAVGALAHMPGRRRSARPRVRRRLSGRERRHRRAPCTRSLSAGRIVPLRIRSRRPPSLRAAVLAEARAGHSFLRVHAVARAGKLGELAVVRVLVRLPVPSLRLGAQIAMGPGACACRGRRRGLGSVDKQRDACPRGSSLRRGQRSCAGRLRILGGGRPRQRGVRGWRRLGCVRCPARRSRTSTRRRTR